MKTNLFLSAATVGLLLAGNSGVSAQEPPPPINAVTGTVALDSTVRKTYEGVHTVIVKTVDGVGHLLHLTERTVVHGGKAIGDDALRGFDQGGKVVVHYTVEGGDKAADGIDGLAVDGLKTIEGVITSVDRHAKTISIRLADGSRQTLRLTERAGAGAGKDIAHAAVDTANVVVSAADDAGQSIAHYFTRVS